MKFLLIVALLSSVATAQITQSALTANSQGGSVVYDSSRQVVWFLVDNPSRIGKLTAGGTVTYYNLPTSAASVAGICYDLSGDRIYGTEGVNNVFQANPNTMVANASTGIVEWSIPEASSGPAGCQPFLSKIYFVETSTNKIQNVDSSGTFGTPIAVGSFPHGPSIGPNGFFRFVLFNGSGIGQIDLSGNYTFVSLPQPSSHPGTTTRCTYKGTAGICFTINTPNGSNAVGQMGFMPDNNQTQGAIVVVNIPTATPDVWGSTTGADGNVYAGERATNKVLLWNMTSGRITEEYLLPNGGQSPNKLCLAFNNLIVLTEHITDNIDALNVSPNGHSVLGKGTLSGSF